MNCRKTNNITIICKYNITKNIKIRIIIVVQSIVGVGIHPTDLKLMNKYQQLEKKRNMYLNLNKTQIFLCYSVFGLYWFTRISTVFIAISFLLIYTYYFANIWIICKVVV